MSLITSGQGTKTWTLLPLYHPLEMVPAAMSALCTHPHPRCCSAREQMPERDSVEKQGDTTADRGQNHRKQAHLALGLSTAHRAVAGRHLPGGGSVTDMLSPRLRLLGEVCAPSHQLSNLAVGVQRNRGEAERGPGAGAAHTPPGSHCTPMTPTCEAACPMLGPHPHHAHPHSHLAGQPHQLSGPVGPPSD